MNVMTLAPGLLAQIGQMLRLRATARAEEPSSATQEAAAVRALADHYQRSDPSFAADLYAAADRHEIAAERAAGR
jgi:hypothetical protein